MDTGLFVSGGMDGVVKVWDTNTLGVVLEFDFKDKVREWQRNALEFNFMGVTACCYKSRSIVAWIGVVRPSSRQHMHLDFDGVTSLCPRGTVVRTAGSITEC